MTDWHSDESFWEDIADVIFSPERVQGAEAEVGQVCALVQPPAGAAVLDAACGVGRHSIALARRGYAVTGVDFTKCYLERARAAAESAGLAIEWIHEDLRKFRREASFDVVVNLLTSFGYFADPADDRRAAENFYASVKPGGRFVMDIMSKEVLARIFRPRDWRENEDGTIVLEERDIARDWSWIAVRWITIRDGKRTEHRFGHRLYSATELCALMEGVGFVDVCAYGSLGGSPYNQDAERLVVVARRPSAP